MSTDTTHVIEGLGTRVQVRGEGPPLLLIGGLWSQLPMWDGVLPFLHGFRTIAFDPPGIGSTALPQRPYSVLAWRASHPRSSTRSVSSARTSWA